MTNACGSPAGDESAPSEFGVFDASRVGETEGFFDLPWPSDARRNADGNIDLDGFASVNVEAPALVRTYERVIGDTLSGYATQTAAYLRFSAPVNESTLPGTVAASQLEESSVFIMNVTADSAHLGARHPVRVSFQ